MNRRITLRVLKEAEKELMRRDKNYHFSYRGSSYSADVGLCDMIPAIFCGLYPKHSKNSERRDLIKKWLLPDFSYEYCHKIAPTTDTFFWWPVNKIDFLNSIYTEGFYDVESRLKVIRHFIEKYSNNDNRTTKSKTGSKSLK